jgi:hypothetical protein
VVFVPVATAPARTLTSTRPAALDLVQRASDIFNLIGSYPQPWAGIELAGRKYVMLESNPALRDLAKDLLANLVDLLRHAPVSQSNEQALNSLREQRRAGRPVSERRFQELRRAICSYNHQLMLFCFRHRRSLNRAKLTKWLMAQTPDSQSWAPCVIAGMAAEVAASQLLTQVVTDLRHGTVEDDLKGVDFTFRLPSGGRGDIDVKTGNSCPAEMTAWNGDTFVFGIRREDIVGFFVNEAAAPAYLATLRTYFK